jgi:hypothetical protein
MICSKFFVFTILTFVLTLLFALLMYCAFTACSNNFHTVIPGKIYRSANLSSSSLQFAINKYHLRSIINLEGEQQDDFWYNDEIAIATRTGVTHYDISLPAHGLPKGEQLKRLIEILQNAPQPLLIHCRYGSDRSGLASAISLILSETNGYDDFDEQISWRYGVLSPSSVGFEVFTNYDDWLQANHLINTKQNFLKWVNGEFAHSTMRYGWVFT